MHILRLGIAAIAALTIGTTLAIAAPATITAETNVYSGPGNQYDRIGVLPELTVVDAGPCQNGYCSIAGSGWVNDKYLSWERAPQPPSPQPLPLPQPQPQPQPPPIFPWPQPQPQPQPWPQPQPPVFEQAGACFYSGRNYTGSSLCLDEGDSYSRLRNWDNLIRSVEVYGGARVDMCTDANFYGSCVTIRNDTSRLPAAIDRRVTSLEVY